MKLTELKEFLGSESFWLPMLFFVSFLASVYMAFAYGLLGIIVCYWWIYIWVAKEIIRESRLMAPSETWETGTEISDKALRELEKLLAKNKPSPP